MTERVLSEVVELDIDKCANTYGVSPCTAGIEDSGTAQGGSATTITLRALASAVDDAYNGMTARLADGRERRIVDYVGASKVATVPTWPADHISMPGVAGNYPSTPDSPAVSLTGDLDFDVLIAMTAYPPPGSQMLASKYGATWSWHFHILSTGFLRAGTSSDGVSGTNADSSAAAGLTAGVRTYLRMQRVAATGVIKYLKSTDDVTWTQIGTDVANTAGAVFDSTAPIEVGAYSGGAIAFAGKIFSFRFRSSIGGPVVAQLNAPDGLLGDTSFQSKTTGETWTINTSGGTPAALAAAPDATTVYDVIDRANACYNTYRTCQDRANYVKGVQTIRFTGAGAPIDRAAPARPTIIEIDTAPTELDLEECVSRRAATSVFLVDAPDSDVEMDPYVRDRATPAGGTWWRRFFARNLNYAGRPARVKRGFVTAGYTVERFIIEAITGPDARGEVRLTLKDPIKLLDRSKAPVPTSGKLAFDLGLNDLQLTLGASEGSQYAASGWVRVGDEVIRYTAKAGDVLSWPDGTHRGLFGTSAAAASIGDGVQQCYVVLDAAFSAVVEELHNLGGIASSELDLAGLASEESTWLGDEFRIRDVCITDPEDIGTLLKELMKPAGMVTWWAPVEQKVKFKVVAPASPAAISVTVLDDQAELIEDSVAVARLEDLRVTLASVNFSPVSAIADSGQPNSYQQTELAVDPDAEGANEYNESRVLTVSSRFYGPRNERAMRTFVQRYVARHRDAPERIEFNLDPKDDALKEGELVDVQTYSLVDAAGNVRTARVLVIRRDATGAQAKYAGRITNFDRPYGFIAPNGTGNYPANNGYACIAQNDGRMTNGDPGYLII